MFRSIILPNARQGILRGVVLTMLLAGAPVHAESPINSYFFGGAIKGYDAVAYHTEGQALKATSEFTFDWRGAHRRFASAHNRDLFAADPEKWAPQYGGYCAWAMAEGRFAGIDPEVFRIVGGKLYLNYSRKVQKKWEKDIPGFIAKADKAYPKLVAQ